MQAFNKLTVQDVVNRERTDRQDEHGNPVTFPVVLIQGVSLNISESGQSINKRVVSLPLNGFTLEEGKAMFPKGSVLDGYTIEQYEVSPYKWETPEGEIRTDNVRYRLAKSGQESKQDNAQAQSSTVSTKAPTEIGAPEEA